VPTHPGEAVVGLEGGKLPLETAWMGYVVGIHAGHEGAPGGGETGLEGRDQPQSLLAQQADAGIRRPGGRCHRRRVVPGAVVHHQALPVGQALPGQAAQGGRQPGGTVPDREQHGHAGGGGTHFTKKGLDTAKCRSSCTART